MTGRLKYKGPPLTTNAALMEAPLCAPQPPARSTQNLEFFLWNRSVWLRGTFLKAAVALHSPGKNAHEKMLMYIGSSKAANEKEFRGVLKWLVCLRLAETKIQFPNAEAILEWTARL